MKVKPLGNKVIIKRSEPEKQTDAGIYLPDSAQDKPKEGDVIALGDGNLNRDTGEYVPFTVKKGDHVLFNSFAGTEIKIDDEEFLIMTEEDILGVVDGK